MAKDNQPVVLRLADGETDVDEQNALPTKLTGSNIKQPTDLQARLQTTIQTHNAVSVAASAWSSSAWIDMDGFDRVAITMLNDASTTSSITIDWSNDGTTIHGNESAGNDTKKQRAVEYAIKARYARINLNNGDTVAHTMSAWAYLKC
jgi:hypothetical protein